MCRNTLCTCVNKYVCVFVCMFVCIYVQSAMDPGFCSTVDITDVIYLPHSSARPPCCQWMTGDGIIRAVILQVDVEDVDESDDSWMALNVHLGTILESLIQKFKVRCDGIALHLFCVVCCIVLCCVVLNFVELHV